MKLVRSLLLSAGLIVASTGVAACGSNDASGGASSANGCPDGNLTFWAQVPSSGPAAAIGQGSADSMRAAVDVVNSKGGVLGHNIELVTEDTAFNPTTAVGNLQALLSKGTLPTIVVPGIASTEVLPGLPLVTKAKVTSVVLAADPTTSDPKLYPYNFNVGSTNAQYSIPAVVDELQAKGYKNFAVAVSDDATGISQRKALEEAGQEDGFTVTAENIPPGTIDPIAQLEKLRASNPDVLVLATGPGALTPAVLKALQTLNWQVPTNATPASANAPLAGLPPEALSNVTLTVPAYTVAGSKLQQTEGYKTYLAAETKQFGGPDKLVLGPDIYANTYSLVIASAAAIEKAGSCETEKVTKAFQSLTAADAPLWFQTSEFGFSDSSHAVKTAVDDYLLIPASSKLVDGSFQVAGS